MPTDTQPSAGTVEAGQGSLHGSITIDVSLPATPDRVYAMFAELPARRAWFRIPSDPAAAHHELDFRVGGHENARGIFTKGQAPEELEYRSRFLDIKPHERIVTVYEFFLNGTLRWASLATVELTAEPTGTHLRHVEQYTYVTYTGDGQADLDHLQGGLRMQLNVVLPGALTRAAEANEAATDPLRPATRRGQRLNDINVRRAPANADNEARRRHRPEQQIDSGRDLGR